MNWTPRLRSARLKDVIQRQLNAEQLQQHMDLIRRANDRPVDASQARDMLRKALQKHEADSVVEAYNSADTVNMPAGNSMWRLSNAISWVAGKTEDAERKLEISKVAGQILESSMSREPWRASDGTRPLSAKRNCRLALGSPTKHVADDEQIVMAFK